VSDTAEQQADGARDADLIAVLDALRGGDLTRRPAGSDPLSLAVSRLAEALEGDRSRDLDCAVHLAIDMNEAAIAAARILSSARDIDGRAQSIAAATEELVASVAQISETSDAAAAGADEMRSTVQHSVGAVRNAVEAMGQIASTVEAATAKVDALNAASEEIGGIVQSIDAIAKQTNLLALNATIEAARAGEAGKGFAVVAGEVKALSQQTAEATNVIRQRIAALRGEIAGIVASMAEGGQAVTTGRSVMDELDADMAQVGGGIESVAQHMGEIAGILSDQRAATGEVSEGISGIAGLTADNVHQVDRLADVMAVSQQGIGQQLGGLARQEFPDKVVRLAKADHVIWKKRLVDMAVGREQLRAEELSDHHSCRLGKWYYGDASTPVRGRPAFRALEEPHRLVHEHGKRAAALFQAGKLDEALAAIELVETASADVVRLLDDLKG
jgi:methyl-accepting chemotaxis protein